MAHPNDCGCCAGTASATPAPRGNAPGLPSISYRAGTQPAFKASLLARLSSTDYPALAPLTTRRDDDWTIALCDAFACAAEVLTFYQERIANESYLRTAVERRSVRELARLIGYELAPGVAANTALAFTLESAPGQPDLAAQPVTVPIGTRVQSIPDDGQDPQNFETTAAITARVEWNAQPVRTSESIAIAQGLREIFLAGTAHNIQPGDAIVIVGRERLDKLDSDRWDVRWIDRVELDLGRDSTRLVWSKPLGTQWFDSKPAAQGVHVYVFRQRAALFGHNAPDANLLWTKATQGLFGAVPPCAVWLGFHVDETGKKVDLDAAYPKIVAGSWIALAGGEGGTAPTGYVELYQVAGVTLASRSAFGLSGKVTRIQTDGTENLRKFALRETQVLAQSEEVPLARRPLVHPVYGSALEIGSPQPDLAPGQMLAVTGKRQRVAIPADTTGVSFLDAPKRTPLPGDSFLMLSAPEEKVGGEWHALAAEELDPNRASSGTWKFRVLDRDETPITIEAPAGRLRLEPSLKSDAVVSEVIAIATSAGSVVPSRDSTAIVLEATLLHCYERASVSINANVAPATHGETVAEIAGSGDAGRANQSFRLKQSPLTYVSSSTDPSGSESTLQVRANDLLWRERATLHGAAPHERSYAIRRDDDGGTAIEFGDGAQGARLPSGQNNVRLVYRKGIGIAGNLRAGQLSTLLTRPLGVKSVNNPVPSTGGQDQESLGEARKNAPLRLRTLDRAVSTRDYADFARAFAGIAKAYAIWIDDGRARGIHITVAGADGGEIPEGGNTHRDLLAALRRYGDPLLPVTLQTYAAAAFGLSAAIRIAPDADPEKTLADVAEAVRAAYRFGSRDFGRHVTIGGVYAVMQSVGGVESALIRKLYRIDDAGDPQPRPRLFAQLPSVAKDGSVSAAEILTLDPARLEIGLIKDDAS